MKMSVISRPTPRRRNPARRIIPVVAIRRRLTGRQQQAIPGADAAVRASGRPQERAG